MAEHAAPTPAVFLDRDDTLIRNGDLEYPQGVTPGDLLDPSRIELLPGAAEACTQLHAAGFAIIVITNQGGVARGSGTLEDMHACNARLRELIPEIAAVYACPWHPRGTVPEYTREHPWRKPSPGMILTAAEEHSLDLSRSWLVGDAPRDVESGINAGLDPDRCLLLDASLPNMAAAASCILHP